MYDRLLAVPVFLPIVAGVALLAMNGWIRKEKRERTMQWLVEALVLVNSLLVAWLIAGCGGRSGSLVLFRLYGQLTVMFRMDRMGSFFAGLVAFLWPLATLYAFEYMEHDERRPAFFAFYTISYGVTLGVALAGNLVTMYVFYEMLTFATFPLVMHPMTTEAARATRQYLYYSIGGAAFAFIGLVTVLAYSAIGTTGFVPGGMIDPAAAAEHRNLLLFVYVLAFFGFGVKAAVFPLHDWLPKAAVAPTPVTALLHAVAVVKSGAFAVLRFTYFSFGTEILRGTWAQWIVMAAALVTITYASTMAVKEVHFKRRLAYSTISNLSYILFGASMMSPLGLAAALIHLLAHAFMKISAFFCAGAVMHHTGKNYIYELDGMGYRMPVTFACFTISSLSLMGIPLFAGFISKWSLCEAALSLGSEMSGGAGGAVGQVLPYIGVAVILYSALMTGIYMLSVVVRAYFPGFVQQVKEAVAGGSARKAAAVGAEAGITAAGAGAAAVIGAAHGQNDVGIKKEGNQDPSWLMLLPLVIFAVAIVAVGIHAGPVLRFLALIGGEAG